MRRRVLLASRPLPGRRKKTQSRARRSTTFPDSVQRRRSVSGTEVGDRGDRTRETRALVCGRNPIIEKPTNVLEYCTPTFPTLEGPNPRGPSSCNVDLPAFPGRFIFMTKEITTSGLPREMRAPVLMLCMVVD